MRSGSPEHSSFQGKTELGIVLWFVGALCEAGSHGEVLCVGISVFLPGPGDFLQHQGCARVRGAAAGTWGLQKMRCRAGSEQAGCVSGCCRRGKGLLLCPWLALT